MTSPKVHAASIAPNAAPRLFAPSRESTSVENAGCNVLKPAPMTPRTTLLLAELALRAGVPAGVLNVVTGGADIGERLVTDPGVDMVSVTGSTA